MDIVSTFMPLLRVFTAAMTKPTAESFTELFAGWLFAGRRTVSDGLRAVDPTKHHSAYHRIFASARWSIDQVGLALFDLVVKLTEQLQYTLVGDDTLVGRFGLKVYAAGMHRDACQSSSGHTTFRWGHCWVVLCVLIPSRSDPNRKYALPILFRLYKNKKTNEKLRRKHRKKTELMLEMLLLVADHAPEESLHFVGDSAYTGARMLAGMPEGMHVTGRLSKDARLCEAPAERTGKRGRPQVRGKRLPTPEQLLQRKGLANRSIRLYQQTTYHVRITSLLCRLYLAPGREVKVVVTEHLRGGRKTEVFYSTETRFSDEQVLQTYSHRWPVETTFQDSKGHLGLGHPENRVKAAVERTAPTILLTYSLIVLWHEHVREKPGVFVRHWPGKQHASFADMLVTLRRDCIRETQEKIFCAAKLPVYVQKIIKPIQRLLDLAA